MRASTCFIRSSLALCIVLVALAAPSSASAAVSLTSFGFQPSTDRAGAHPALTISAAFAQNPSTDGVKSLTVLMPQGLVGDPNSADRCSQEEFAADACPSTSRIGTTQTNIVVVVVAGVTEVPQSAGGDVYNLRPIGAEPARLGLVIRPSQVNSVSLPKVFLQSAVSVGPQTNYGLSTTFDGIPRSDGPFAIRVKDITLSLSENAARGPFLTNPTDCRSATASATAASYDDPANSTRTAAFTPVACDGLAFTPAVGGTVGGAGNTAQRRAPTLTTVVAFEPGQANAQRVNVILPASVSTTLAQVDRACPDATFDAGGCPASATIGFATASSPLLAADLSAPVVLTRAPNSGLPALSVQFGGSVPLRLRGQTGFSGALVATTFDGLPDLPLSRFGLTITGGTGGLLTNVDNLCSAKAKTLLRVELLAHSGRAAAVSAPLSAAGCPGRPPTGRGRASLALSFRHGLATLSGRLSPPTSAPRLRRALLTLPPTLRPALRGLRVTVRGKLLPRSSEHLHGRTLDLRLPGAGVPSLAVSWSRIRPSAGVARRLRQRPRFRVAVRLTDLLGHSTAVRVTLRARPGSSA